MTSWIITQTNDSRRLGVAVVDQLDVFTARPTSAIFIPEYMGGEYWEQFDSLGSPLGPVASH